MVLRSTRCLNIDLVLQLDRFHEQPFQQFGRLEWTCLRHERRRQETGLFELRNRRYRVLDLINTHECARELLDARVAQVNSSGRYDNAIYCSSGEYVERLRERGHTVFVVDTPRSLNPLQVMSAVWNTRRLLRREKFDIVHTHTSVVGMVGRAAALLARVPVIVHQVHGFHHHDKMPWLRSKKIISLKQ